jgi:hypothetical protein
MLVDHSQPSRICSSGLCFNHTCGRFAFSRRLLLGDTCHTVPETPLFPALVTGFSTFFAGFFFAFSSAIIKNA